MTLMVIGCCLLVTSCTGDYVTGPLSKTRGINVKHRTSRSALFMGVDVLKALRARNLLLHEARLVHSNGKQSFDFVKRGTYKDSIRDFNAARPSNVEEIKMPDMTIQTGRVGNMKVVFKTPHETGYPTLTLYTPNPGAKEIIYNIIYSKDEFKKDMMQQPFVTELFRSPF